MSMDTNEQPDAMATFMTIVQIIGLILILGTVAGFVWWLLCWLPPFKWYFRRVEFWALRGQLVGMVLLGSCVPLTALAGQDPSGAYWAFLTIPLGLVVARWETVNYIMKAHRALLEARAYIGQLEAQLATLKQQQNHGTDQRIEPEPRS